MATLREAREKARALEKAADWPRALRAWDQILAADPLDYVARLKIADMLFRVGAQGEAASVYRAVADHDIRSGHPLPAVVAIKNLAALGQDFSVEELLGKMADIYAGGSPKLARFAARQAPVDLAAPIPDLALDGDEPGVTTAHRAVKRALDLSVFVQYPEQYHPIPFLSELEPDVLIPVLRAVTVRHLDAGAAIIREGEPGSAFYLVADGEVRVYATDSLGRHHDIARLHENALFGEMSLLTSQPRTATVEVVGEAHVLEVGREALLAMAAKLPNVATALDRFARERLLKNLLATSPLFKPFTRPQQMDLIRRFDGHDVAPETVIIREGEPGQGLFIVLSGEVEVTKHHDGGEVTLARLRTGEVFGEMSLVKNQATTATVRAARQSTVLFLAREYFQRLIDALPEIRSYFEALSERRDLDTKLTLGHDDEIEIDEDDLVMV